MAEKSEGKKFRELAEMIGWTGNILELRVFILLCMRIYKQVNENAARSFVEYYFDLEASDLPSWRNYHVRAREVVKALYICFNRGLDMQSVHNEIDLIEEIMYG